ncbi:hypothetical protein TCAL_03629 [Tigriopus californicus]|uniref:S-adenosylmethionine mitochondrial carrier protein n=1 Tax=Tigriopus californicus TaxID=6832 RepID=A0A553NDF2_TIGCA|nr:mitochondrial S-adenosylmethionine carrier protein-like [Tigriopus californicus]TRY63438.1 hypothetical protein TCAL_03629 [Tigriopus californicus]|eukprot:TCALIF_03629-PA protein Name:"Similar to Slc25a26 S-adenosylmethionine mitochondrial carrier protein (Mus musculus)" AED:0.05 eAED:0.05 QI:0/-1/0/1/-1/1/1/0/276
MASPSLTPSNWWVALVAGGLAGTAVDVSLFPLDTIKTRLQSGQGFGQAGGFRLLYAGLGPVLVGSAPNAALFFVTYESVKSHLYTLDSDVQWRVPIQMASAAAGEAMACVVRVPVEIVKQRRQAGANLKPRAIIRDIIRHEGGLGLYRGYTTTLLREIPFAFIQFPLWEWLKARWSASQVMEPLRPWQSSLCGAVAGGTSAALTTPLDVAKTRIMLAARGSQLAQNPSTILALQTVWRESGATGLMAGVTPRTLWISVGGAIFFGVYEKAKTIFGS